MAKQRATKSASGGRNAERANGKAWGRHHRSSFDTVGHNATGRTKPSGCTKGGHSVRKLNALCQVTDPITGEVMLDIVKMQSLLLKIETSRDTQHRRALRAGRRAR